MLKQLYQLSFRRRRDGLGAMRIPEECAHRFIFFRAIFDFPLSSTQLVCG
jgi:hypothetical protein